ncbi:hypothetical protein ACWDU2_34225, partial [Nocardia nova]
MSNQVATTAREAGSAAVASAPQGSAGRREAVAYRVSAGQTAAREAGAGAAFGKSPRASRREAERIRTYNFPENRITDHRIGLKANNLESLLDGEL